MQTANQPPNNPSKYLPFSDKNQRNNKMKITRLSISILLYKTKSRNFKSHGLKAVGCLEEQMRAQQTDFFMVCNMATKKSGIPDQPVQKIRFEIFKTLSCLHFLAKFNEFLIFCSSCRAVQKILLAFSCTGSSGFAKSVSVFSSYSRLQYRSVVHPYQHFLLLIGVKKFPFGFLNFSITL